MDHIPSYILVVSKVLNANGAVADQNKETSNLRRNKAADQDDARPTTNEDAKKEEEKKGQVLFRILSLSMLADEQMEDQKSEEDKQQDNAENTDNNFSSPDFKRRTNAEPSTTTAKGVVPTP